METEKFQDLVLNHLAKLTQEVTELKSGQQRTQSDITALKSGQQRMESDITELKSGQQRMESKINTIQAQTAKTTEDLSTLSVKVDQEFTDVVEVQKSLIEMYGQHETDIRTLRRRPV